MAHKELRNNIEKAERMIALSDLLDDEELALSQKDKADVLASYVAEYQIRLDEFRSYLDDYFERKGVVRREKHQD